MTDPAREPLPRSAVVINCVDGRVQRPVLRWMRERLGTGLVHSVTEPGPDRSLARGDGAARVEPIVRMLAEQGPVEAVAVAAHHDCRGDPADEATHREQVRRAVEVVAGWGHAERTLGLWVDHRGEVALVHEAAGSEGRDALRGEETGGGA